MNNRVLATLTAVLLMSWAAPVYADSCKDECKQVFAEQVENCTLEQGDDPCVEQARDSKEFCKFCCKHSCPACGDVNGDGIVNIIDAMLIGQSTVDLAELSCR